MGDDIEVPAERRFEPWIRPLSAVPLDPPPSEGALRQAAREGAVVAREKVFERRWRRPSKAESESREGKGA
jgi:hypothetical protein